jgi:NADPH-dependent F420 reductase
MSSNKFSCYSIIYLLLLLLLFSTIEATTSTTSSTTCNSNNNSDKTCTTTKMSTTTVSIIGGGKVGIAIATTLARGGNKIIFGSRKPEEFSKDVLSKIPGSTVVSLEEAAKKADVAFFTLPSDIQINVGASLAKFLEGKVVVDTSNPIKWDKGPVHDPPREGSISVVMQAKMPNSFIIKSFNHLGVENMLAAKKPIDMYYAGDNETAKQKFAALIKGSGFNPVDAGLLRNAGHLESMCVLWIQIAGTSNSRNWTFGMVNTEPV